MRILLIKIGFYSIATGLLLLNSCKEEKCKEIWTIKGRLLNGTTLQPIKNVWFSATLYDLNHNNKATNQTPVGQGITDDSGYFSIEYPCKEKTFEKIDFETLAPYGGYVRDNVKFEKNYFNTFYFATQGSSQIILKEKTPLNGDTLFLGYYKSINPQTFIPEWIEIDSLYGSVQKIWKTIRTNNGGAGAIYYERGQNRFIQNQAISNRKEGVNTEYIKISGDPIIDSVIINY